MQDFGSGKMAAMNEKRKIGEWSTDVQMSESLIDNQDRILGLRVLICVTR
jgi:hypothetical protein